MNKDQHRFKDMCRVESDRLQDWDYGDSARYFVTICTKHKEAFFGQIIKEEMILSPLGVIAEEEWKRTEKNPPN